MKNKNPRSRTFAVSRPHGKRGIIRLIFKGSRPHPLDGTLRLYWHDREDAPDYFQQTNIPVDRDIELKWNSGLVEIGANIHSIWVKIKKTDQIAELNLPTLRRWFPSRTRETESRIVSSQDGC